MSKVANLIRSLPYDLAEVSSRSGIQPDRVNAIAEGEAASLDELRALARGLRIPMRTFIGGEPPDESFSMLFRQGPGSRPDLGVEAASEFVAAALKVLPAREDVFDWIKDLRLPANTYVDAENLANQFRERYLNNLMDPITSLPESLVNLGVILGRLDTSRFEGASLVVDGYAFVFVSPRFAGRMLFTLAHELGHVLAHHRQPRSAVFDLASQIGGLRHNSKHEAFVDAFASNLLMPSGGVAIALREIRDAIGSTKESLGDIEILYLAFFYGVSFEVAARRCEQLELLPSGGAYSLFDHLKKTHGNAEKLAEKLGLPPRASLSFPRASENLLAAAADKINSGEVSIGWVTDRFGCSANDIHFARAKHEAGRGYRH